MRQQGPPAQFGIGAQQGARLVLPAYPMPAPKQRRKQGAAVVGNRHVADAAIEHHANATRSCQTAHAIYPDAIADVHRRPIEPLDGEIQILHRRSPVATDLDMLNVRVARGDGTRTGPFVGMSAAAGPVCKAFTRHAGICQQGLTAACQLGRGHGGDRAAVES